MRDNEEKRDQSSVKPLTPIRAIDALIEDEEQMWTKKQRNGVGLQSRYPGPQGLYGEPIEVKRIPTNRKPPVWHD